VGSRPELLQGVQGQASDQVDVTGVDQLPAVHRGQRRLDVRCVHVGDIDDGRETVPRDQEQRRNRQNRKRRAAGVAAQMSPKTVQSHVAVLVVRAQQEAHVQRCQRSAQVRLDTISYKTPMYPNKFGLRVVNIRFRLFCSSEILIEERHQQKETLRRENRRVHTLSWGERKFLKNK